MQRPFMRAHALVLAAMLTCVSASLARAQAPPTTPAFSLATSHIYSTKESPAFSLTHRGVDHLDFRVYRVNDAFAFFEKLRDAHELGSEEPVVAQERTLLERIAAWKSERRSDVRGFLRRQFSSEYRHVRNQQNDQQQVVLRQTLNVNSFAQVPLLNPSQLVTSWREILPPVREAEYRRIPLDVSSTPGVYVVEAVNAPLRAYTVVIVSDVGLVTKAAPAQLLVYAANRFSGEPLPGCRVEVLADQKPAGSGTTAGDGTFQAAAVQVSELGSLVTIADCNGQAAATDPSAFSIREPSKTLVGYTYTDRPIYRPGHTVRYKSVLRWRERGAVTPFAGDSVEVSIVDGDEKVLVRENKSVDEFGAVNGSFVVPPTAKLGYYVIHVASGDNTATGSFEVQEYRKPEFDVAVTPASKLERQGGNATITIAARYYFGQPVAGAAVTYTLHRQPYYSSLRFDASDDGEGSDDFFGDGGDATFEGTATLNDRGEARVTVPLDVDERGHDYTAHVEARVTDASSREVTGGASLAATFGRFMLIATADRYVHKPGESMTARVRAVDYEGTALANTKVHVALEHVDYRDGYDNPRITTIAQSDVVTDTGGRAQWDTTTPSNAGSYRLRFSAPSEGREVADTASIWVPGNNTDVEDDSDRFLELIADRRTYQPGDTARLMVQGEAFEASVLVTKESQHISYHQVLKTSSGNAIEVPITADDIGDTYVSIAFLKDDRLFRAERRLTVPAASRQLNITAETDRPVVRPGEPGTFTLHVTDAAGAPVRAQLSLGLVDEAIYGVRPDATPDPLRFFYRREFNEVSTSFSRFYPFVGYSGTEQLILAARRKPMTLADFKADRPDRPRVRKDFPDTVYWAANVTTDTAGTARVKIDYPDSLTTWRLTARAVTASTQVGATTTHTTTTKDLILRVITPRFLTEGDHVTVPAIVHNYLAEQATVAVTVTGDGLASPDGQNASRGARSVAVPQNGQQRTDWDFAANAVRPVTLTGKATSAVAGDAMAVTLPVNPAGLQRNAGSSGSLVGSNERSLEFSIPASANASARTVRVSLAPSLAGAMLGALDYLTSFPWGCTEQTLSSFVPNLTVLRALGDMNISPTERLGSLDRQVADGLTRLYDYQHDDGGWGWWKTDQNHPFMTAYAVDGLLKAREAGSRVEEFRIQNGARALVELWTKYPRALPDLKAYEAYVLARAGAPGFDVDGALTELWNARSRMSTTGQAYLLMTLDGRKTAKQVENAATPAPTSSAADDSRANTLAGELLAAAKTQGDLSSWPVSADALLEDIGDTTVEATALALEALSARGTQDQTLERAARWLMANRNNGSYWVSTKQTAVALEGLLAFMKARGEKPAPVVADVTVNGVRVGTTRFDAAALLAPNPTLIEAPATSGVNAIRITKQGEGALYFDAGVRYYDPPASAERTGTRRLALLREYFSLTPVQVKGRIVYRESAFSGTAKPGDLLLVRLTIAGSNDWRYLMVEDPLPAGAESVEKEEPYELEKRRTWDYGSQRELRDDRTVYFLDNLAGGRHEFNYMLKVTTPGQFNAMPAHVSPMYVPDVSASSDVMPLTVSAEGVR